MQRKREETKEKKENMQNKKNDESSRTEKKKSGERGKKVFFFIYSLRLEKHEQIQILSRCILERVGESNRGCV